MPTNSGEAAAGPSLYEYTGPQRKVLRLYELRKESLRFEKYYACRLKWHRRWNMIGDAAIAVSASGALASATFMKTPAGQELLTVALVFSTFATILKPVIKLNDRIIRLSKLQVQYLELYQDFTTLMYEVREADEVQPKHEKQLSILNDRYNKLGLQNDPGESSRLMRRFQAEVEIQIPNTELWLPQNDKQPTNTPTAIAKSASSVS
jgi:hypothetical protein